MIDEEILKNTYVNTGETLAALSVQSPILLVFLRHLGCTFCRETLSDIAEKMDFLRSKKIQPVFVHMSSEHEAQPILEKYHVEGVPRISDPEKKLYQAFGLQRGKILQLLGLKVWWRGFMSAIIEGHGFGKLMGDGFQMPGVFLIHKGKILKDFRHRTAAERPDYQRMSDVS
jgi:peroxiredoxin